MEFAELVKIVGEEPVFETGLLQAGHVNRRDILQQLSRWKQAGKIYQLRRGLYCLAPPFQKIKPHPFHVSKFLVRPSYVSLQSALAFHGLIPEYVPVTTCVTTGRPTYLETPLGNFDFRHVQVSFFEGYRVVDLGMRQTCFIAQPEKALLDLIYIQPNADSLDYLVELRLSNLHQLNWQNLDRMAQKAAKPKLIRSAERLRALFQAEEDYQNL